MDSCNIKVAIKARPLNPKEQLDGRIYWKVECDSVIHVDPITEKKTGEQFFFDRVFCGKSTNYDVFDDIVKPIIDRGVQGFNGTVFAYGQTASGKTYTMSGDQSNPGIIPLAINYMFSVMNSSTSREYLLRASYVEIYNEKVIDLLEKKHHKNQPRKIEIQKDGLHITPLKAIVCQNAQMVIDLMKIGEKNRSIGETNMNERSSRSHTIFRIILESRNINDDCDGAYQQSVINLVDLAGSERGQTQLSMERFKEGCKINSSLTTLSLVIQQLSECPDNPQHINFRDSKLTRILQTSLGGNSLTAIICTVTLAVDDQTQNTLNFASRAKKIKNTAKINENITDETLLKRYRIQLAKLNEELEGMKRTQYKNNEVNEIKYKYQEEKRTNEELKTRIMRLQNSMITSSIGHKDQLSNKKEYSRRRTWGGKLDNTFSSSSILETIEEDVNMPRPSVPSYFGNQNKELKTPLEPFEWDLIREEDCTVDNESLNKENTIELSPTSNMPLIVCETPKKVLRERVNNYKNMFELSMKENNELREFTTLEKQMFYENNEQLKDLGNLRKQVENLQNEKNESTKIIEKLRRSVQLIENEKRDIEVVMEMQKNKYDTRETELLITIQETKNELKSKEEQLKKVISNNTFMAEKQEEIKRFEMKMKEMSQLNNTYINEIENLKIQLLNKDQKLNEESAKYCSVLDELSFLQNHVAKTKSVPYAIQILSNEGFFTLKKSEIEELDVLLEHVYNTVEQLQQDNHSLKDENNNLKLYTINFTDTMKNMKKENNELKSQLILIETNIRSVIKEFSESSAIDVDVFKIDDLIEFAANSFEQNTNKFDEISEENHNLKNKLSLSNNKLNEIKLFMFDTLDNIYNSISSMEVESNMELQKFKKELFETLEENIFLKSSIDTFNKLSSECIEIVEQLKTSRSDTIHLQEDLNVCNTMKNEFQIQIEQLNALNADLKISIETQNKVEKEIRNELNIKSVELLDALTKLDQMHFTIENNEFKSNVDVAIVDQPNIELQTVKSHLQNKSNLVVEPEEAKLKLLSNYNELNECYQLNIENIKQDSETEKQLRDELETKTNCLKNCVDELEENKIKIKLNESEINKLNTLLNSVNVELNDKIILVAELENIKLEMDESKNYFKKINELKLKLEVKYITAREELLTKTQELKCALVQLTNYKITNEEMKAKVEYDTNVIEKLNTELDIIKHELEEKIENEKVMKNELQIVTMELDNTICKVDEVKLFIDILNNQCETDTCIVKQLKNDLETMECTLTEKTRLIVELENTNCKHSEVLKQLNKVILESEIKLENKTKIITVLEDELQSKITQLEEALIRESEVQSLVESMENEIKSNIISIEQVKSELAKKSNLLTEVENINCDLLLKLNDSKYKNYEEHSINLQEQIQTLNHEKDLILTDLNLANQKLLEVSKTKTHLEDTLQLHELNYQKLYEEFNNLSNDIESLIQIKTKTELNLKKEINDLQKQLHESSLEQHYSKLEEEYVLKSRECNEAIEKIINLEKVLSTKEEIEISLRSNLQSKISALTEYKNNVEFLFSRNDSFQIRVNDFEENVLVNLNEEFDLMKSELAKKTEYEQILLDKNAKLEYNLREFQEKFSNITKELESNEERSDDLASIINVLVIEIKDANSIKENLESRLNEAEHELLKAEDLAKTFEHELYISQKELESACAKADNIEKELVTIESKFNDKINEKYLEGCDVSKQLFDPLVDYVHDIKLKLTELNSAMISGNKCERKLRTKVISADDGDILPLDKTWKITCTSLSPKSSDDDLVLDIGHLRKELEDKTELINILQKDKNDMEKNISELQNQIKQITNENNIIVDNLTQIENDLKEKTWLVNNLTDELNQFRKQYTELEEHNRATKEQIHYSFDIDTELRNGKKNIIQEINLLEPGKITGAVTHHNLSNLLDTFVGLIMTKEQQIVTGLINDHNKTKQQYEEQIKQLKEDFKKAKEWQEQVESDNEKLCLELENLKSEKHNFPNKEIEIKELTEKVLEAEVQSYDYLVELQELKTQISKTSEQNYQALSNEFEVFKTSSEQSIQDLKKKIGDLTDKYNESLTMYKDQRNSRSTLEDQVEKIQSECDCLQAIIKKKDQDIKHLVDKVELNSIEYETLIEKNGLQKEEMKEIYGKKIDELQMELNEKTQKIHCTEKLLKEITKNHNQLIEENSLNLLKIKQLESNCHETIKLKDEIKSYQLKLRSNDNDSMEVNNVTVKLREILKCTGALPTLYENIGLLVTKYECLAEEIEDLKRTNTNLDNECESMLMEFQNKDDKIIELLTQESDLKQTIEFLTEERDFLKNKCEQLKNVNDDVKKLNDEICNYEQNIYQLRKEKGQLIVQHDKELKQMKSELNEVHIKNLQLLNEYNKLTETAKNLEKSLKEDIQQLNRCIVDKNAKISTLELFSKTNTDDLKKKNYELEHIFKKMRDENHILRKELRRLKEITHVRKADQSSQTVEEQSVVSSAIIAGHKSMTEKITKLENDNQVMKKILHHRKIKIEELQKQLAEKRG